MKSKPNSDTGAERLPKELIWIAGGDIDRLTLTLRFFGDDLDPDAVSSLLACPATESHRMGDVIHGKTSQRLAKTGMWRLSRRPPLKGLLENEINALLDTLPAEKSVWESLAKFNGDIFVGLFLERWNRGFSLSPQLMKRLAERNLTLDFDIYFSEEKSEDDSSAT